MTAYEGASARMLHNCIVALVLCASCGRPSENGSATSLGICYEGRGFVGFCAVGQTIGEVEQLVGRLELTYDNKDKHAPWTTYRVVRSRLWLDAFGRGKTATIARIVIGFPRSHEFVTETGLIIAAGETATIGKVEEVYGPVVESFDKSTNEISKAVLAGRPYRELSPDGKIEFRHYPTVGIGFLVSEQRVIRCYINRPNDRPVWGL